MAWLTDDWNDLKSKQEQLSDDEFLERFQPILETFRARTAILERFAQRLREIYRLRGLNILETASGADVFPAILRREDGCRATGLEAETSLTARYCRIHHLPLISPPDWTTWTDEVFDLVVVTCYITAPGSTEWANEMTAHFCHSALYQIEHGAELVLFDTRYVEPFADFVRAGAHAVEWRRYPGPDDGVVIFYRRGQPSARRIEAPADSSPDSPPGSELT